MKINFYLRFHTKFGETLRIKGNIDELGNNQLADAIQMQYVNEQFWRAAIEVDATRSVKIHYNYILTYADGYQVIDGERDRVIDISKTGMEEIETIDSWNHEGAFENVFFTSPFQQILLPHQEKKPKVKAVKTFTHIFKVKAPLLK